MNEFYKWWVDVCHRAVIAGITLLIVFGLVHIIKTLFTDGVDKVIETFTLGF